MEHEIRLEVAAPPSRTSVPSYVTVRVPAETRDEAIARLGEVLSELCAKRHGEAPKE